MICKHWFWMHGSVFPPQKKRVIVSFNLTILRRKQIMWFVNLELREIRSQFINVQFCLFFPLTILKYKLFQYKHMNVCLQILKEPSLIYWQRCPSSISLKYLCSTHISKELWELWSHGLGFIWNKSTVTIDSASKMPSILTVRVHKSTHLHLWIKNNSLKMYAKCKKDFFFFFAKDKFKELYPH